MKGTRNSVAAESGVALVPSLGSKKVCPILGVNQKYLFAVLKYRLGRFS